MTGHSQSDYVCGASFVTLAIFDAPVPHCIAAVPTFVFDLGIVTHIAGCSSENARW